MIFHKQLRGVCFIEFFKRESILGLQIFSFLTEKLHLYSDFGYASILSFHK